MLSKEGDVLSGKEKYYGNLYESGFSSLINWFISNILTVKPYLTTLYCISWVAH